MFLETVFIVNLQMFPALGNVGEDVVPTAIRSRHSSGRQRRSSVAAALGDRAPTWLTGRCEYRKSEFEVPLSISKRFRDVQFKTLVGVAPAVPAAWYSVDDSVFIWRFRKDKEVTRVIQCDGVVTAVAIGVPCPGVFPSDLLKYIAVVCTENSVSLFGLDAELRQVKLDGYFLAVPNAGTVFTQASITLTGRVLLHTQSDPSTLYEVRYRSSASWFKSRIYYHYHSLMLTSGTPGVLSNMLSKLVISTQNIFKQTPATKYAADSVRLFIHTDSTFKFFVSVDSSNLNLYEISPAPCGQAVSSASWRHLHAANEDIIIRCVGRISLTELISGNSSVVPRRVLSATVMTCVDTEEPVIQIVTDYGDLISLKTVASGELVVAKTRSQPSNASAPQDAWTKKQRTSFGTAAVSMPTCSVGGYSEVGGNGVLICGQRTKLTVSTTDSVGDFEVNGSVLSVMQESSVEIDTFGSFVIPPLTTSGTDLIAPGPKAVAAPLIVLTGKGVTTLDPAEPQIPTGHLPPAPQSVADVVKILCAHPNVTFAYKPMFVRAISDDVCVSSYRDEQDYASRQFDVKPLSGGVWIGGVKKLSESMLFVLRNEPLLIRTNSGVRVAIAKSILETVGSQLATLIKFVKIVLASVNAGPSVSSVDVCASFRRREFMHGSAVTREQVVKNQAAVTLQKIISHLSVVSEVIGLFSLVAEYRSTSVTQESDPLNEQWSVTQFTSRQGQQVLSRICGRLLELNSDKSTEIVEKLRATSPTILCTVSPSLVPSSEGIAALLQCAMASGSPVHVLLGAVVQLARNTPSVHKVLTEVGQILRSLGTENSEAKQCVLVAVLDGLQERLMDESIVTTVLSWSGNSLSGPLNEYILSYLFARGQSRHVHLVCGSNQWIERFLAARTMEGRIFAESYANLLVKTGRNQMAGDVLEKLAFNAKLDNFSLTDKIALLEQANAACSTSRRFELVMIAKHVQEPLIRRLADLSHEVESLDDFECNLLSVSDLHLYAKQNALHDIVLRCFLFVQVKEADLVKAWTNCLFDFAYFTHNRTGSVMSGILNFLREFRSVSETVDSFSIWKKPEITSAILEYIACLTECSTVSVAADVLVGIQKLSPLQVIECYTKMVREINVWMSKLPRVGGDFAPVSAEAMKDHLISQAVSFAEKSESRMASPEKLLTYFTLIRNSLTHEHEGVSSIIDRLSRRGDDGTRRPTLEGL